MKRFFIVAFFIVFSLSGFGQQSEKNKALDYLNNHGEVYFNILTSNPMVDVMKVGKMVYVDKIGQNNITAYANNTQFSKFLTTGLSYRVLTPPSMVRQPKMVDDINLREINDWDFYPTYETYVSLMQQFQTDYPSLCELISIDTLDSGRELLFIHINNDLTTAQNEPEFMYTSTMHGDEVTGYVLMLHLIDYLLSNYGVLPEVTNMLDSIDIWINPLANPDGTYHGGNNTVYGATRTNANNIDLNRNYPDPEAGPHPDGNVYQDETVAFMAFADEHDLVMSANLHGGSEVANYPWDTWPRLTADNDWWYFVSREFADTIHQYAVPGYFTSLNNGVTNGYSWYSITGGRQDYMNYFKYCREFTLELSFDKTPPASQLPDFWAYDYRSFLNYMKESTYGVRGVITNSQTGNPVQAKVYIAGHDADNSEVYSSLPVGNYHRMLKAGSYNITYSAFGYYSQTITVTVTDKQATVLDVQLQPAGPVLADFYASDTTLASGDVTDFFDASYGDSIVSWSWSFPGGDPASSSDQNPQEIMYNEVGQYNVTLTVTDSSGAQSQLTKENYISVSENYLMQNGSFTICSGNFYDTGGNDANYGNNEDLVLTFFPSTTNAKMVADFINFDVEPEYNCSYDYLEIYDGSSISATPIGLYCGTENPGKITATNGEGALTFKFHSDGAVTHAGWEAVMSCDTGVGIGENETHIITIHPNPAKDFVTIESDEIITDVKLLDVSGHIVMNNKANEKQVLVNIGILPKGIYFVKIGTRSKQTVRKLVKR
ncbi:MAG: hypothetical protein DRJ09_03100 [Bacteroidetes bacterium]|nr:MAG: hypothetical protein DRJ09_03100 [Bacteroidota bacterium]